MLHLSVAALAALTARAASNAAADFAADALKCMRSCETYCCRFLAKVYLRLAPKRRRSEQFTTGAMPPVPVAPKLPGQRYPVRFT